MGVDRASVPPGYLMHIMTVGRGARATLCGREGTHIVNALHRDVSGADKTLCDTCLCGVLGRKRVILFAPDEFPTDYAFARRPDLSSEKLRPLVDLPEQEAWKKLEELATSDGVRGGVFDLGPGRFLFVPHGWWHAVQPIDDFTFITGPSHLSDRAVAMQ